MQTSRCAGCLSCALNHGVAGVEVPWDLHQGLGRGRAPQGFAVTDKLVQPLRTTWDLADQPGLQHLAELLQVRLVEQVEEGGI